MWKQQSTIYVMDWLINKPIKLKKDKNDSEELNPWDKIIYTGQKNAENLIWTYLWYTCDTNKEWIFIKKLSSKEEKKFNETNNKNHKKYFPIFKRNFSKFYPQVTPITSRTNFYGNTIYFYFFCEERIDFTNFLPELKKYVSTKFFLFQLWARDKIKMDPNTENLFWPCGYKLCCKRWNCPLPSVESSNISLQNLKYIDSEKLKWRCDKLKCCLNYEKEIYENETFKYPGKGDNIKFKWIDYTCFSSNIMTGEIIAKNEEENIKINIDDIEDKK